MYTALIILVLITLVFSLPVFGTKRNWVLIYTAFGNEDYFSMIAKLKKSGIKYKTKTPIQFRTPDRFNDYTQYDIYIKKEDVHRVHKGTTGHL